MHHIHVMYKINTEHMLHLLVLKPFNNTTNFCCAIP